MRVFHIAGEQFRELDALPEALPEGGFLWVGSARREFEVHSAEVQAALQRWTGGQLVDLHVSDLLNNQLPSHFDYTSWYDLMVFRRLAQRDSATADPQPATRSKRPGPPVLQRIDTSPVGFAVFDRVLLSVHPADCAVREAYAARLLAAASHAQHEPDTRSTGARGIPRSPADMMLRILSQMVDGYLDLRRDLSRQLDHWQTELLSPRTRFSRWDALLHARAALHQLESLCEDQRTAVQNWTE